MFQAIQVGNGFAHGEHGLVCVQIALEQRRDQLAGRFRRVAGGAQGLKTLAVMLGELCRAGVNAAEGASVRGQHQGVVGQFGQPLDESRNSLSGLPSGVADMTLTLVEMRGSSMSPEISTFSSAQ